MPKYNMGRKKSVLAWTITLAFISPINVFAAENTDDVTFDPGFLSNTKGGKVDLSQFNRPNVLAAGSYSIDVVLNNEWVGKEDIRFIPDPGNNKITTPCYKGSFFSLLNLNAKKLPHQELGYVEHLEKEGYCGDITKILPGVTLQFDTAEQKLSITVPQLFLNSNPRGFVDPSRWEDGLTALMVNYNANVYQSKVGSSDNTYGYLGLRNGINLGGWQVRNSGTFNWNSGADNHYTNTATYVGHDIPSWQSQFIAGDAFTGGDLFDGIRFRGVRLYSDDRMLPDSQRGYAPIVRGVANSNARVVITQNGFNVYTTTVSPGPFEITDLFPNSYGGDLTVRIEEANGDVRTFSVPYSSLAQLLRPGMSRYEFAVGQVNSYGLTHKPEFGSLTYQRGLTNDLTGYAGSIVSQGYLSALMGAAINTPIGAFSLDATQANTNLPHSGSRNGQSYRLGYNQLISETQTNFSLLAYRYSTDGFLGLSDAVQLRDMELSDQDISSYQRPQSRFTLSVNQMLPDRWGSLFSTANYTTYWDNSGSQQSFQLGYNNSISSIFYSLSVNRTLTSTSTQTNFSGQTHDTQFAVSISVPLGESSHSPTLSLTGTTDDQTRTAQAGLSGTYGSDNAFNYNMNFNRDTSANSSAFNGGVGYRTSLANLSASYGYSQGSQQYSAGADGAIVVHSGGVTLGQSMGETSTLVHAAGAAGAEVLATTGVYVDRFGYAIVPYMRPYYINRVELDPKGTSDNVEMLNTLGMTVPRSGALTLINYETDSGRLVYIKAMQKNGSPLPFAANVYDEHGKNVGVVAQSSMLVLRGIDNSGVLRVKWGDSEENTCTIHYQLPPEKSENKVIQGVCEI